MKFLWTAAYVTNLEESITFYTTLLDLQVIRRFPAGPGVEIAFMGNYTDNETFVELIADKSRSSISFTDSISIGFAISSVDEMLDIVKKNNITVETGPFETPGSRYFTIKDPNGLNVQFFQQKQ